MILESKSLTYSYPGSDKKAINGLTFAMNEGEIFGFLGPSGAGKSTTQRILFNHLKGYTGSVRLFDKEIKSWSHELYKFIGVGFELPNHFLKLSARENLVFFSSFYKRTRDIDELLERVGLAEHADKKVKEFSKGMKMRLNFVRAILHHPRFLFLDEPTSGLDPTNAKTIKDMILEEKRNGVSIFLTTHQMSDADMLCDRVAFLSDGEIAAMDTPLNLKLAYGKASVQLNMMDKSQHEFELLKLGTNEGFLELIRHAEIKTIHSKEASLEDIFIKVTGKRLDV